MKRLIVLSCLLLSKYALADVTCDEPGRYSVRTQYTYEDYSFSDPGHTLDLSWRDRSYRGWDIGAGVSYVHRFRLDDGEAVIQAAHKLPWMHSWVGASLGGASHAVLLPRVQGSLFGGLGLGYGFSAENTFSFRHYDTANVWSMAPVLSWEGSGLLLAAGYTLSATDYTDGARSGGLSSYSAKAQLTRWCVLQPWLGYARAHEPFQEGLVGNQSFTSNHYMGGVDIWLGKGFKLYTNYDYEDRFTLSQHISYYGAGVSYSWGTLP